MVRIVMTLVLAGVLSGCVAYVPEPRDHERHEEWEHGEHHHHEDRD